MNFEDARQCKELHKSLIDWATFQGAAPASLLNASQTYFHNFTLEKSQALVSLRRFQLYRRAWLGSYGEHLVMCLS